MNENNKQTVKEIKRQPISESWWSEPPVGKGEQAKYFNEYRKPENFIRMSPLLTIWTNLVAWFSNRKNK